MATKLATSRRLIAASVFSAAAILATLNAPDGGADTPDDFQTPSGNIYCQMSSGVNGVPQVWCEGGGSQAGPAPACAEHMQWGDRISMVQGQAPESHCHTDTIRTYQTPPPVLEYGQTASSGTITCDSETTGLTCTDSSTGHSFSMAKEGNALS